VKAVFVIEAVTMSIL